ncbi:amino acid adenylation domain-containing protein [Sphaerisporangium sp. NPDC005288]|uniref:amino acid adenylation domain-containing protein n=1 Tax=Sphaerisporangium sp. NPDC005288 TaxID=3155114 RepID=UPI0033A0801E
MESLHTLMSEWVRKSPDSTAVVDEAGALTYGELDAESTRIARALCARGMRPDDRVCLLIPKSTLAVSAILGVLKAGGVYIPLDGKNPALRTSQILKTSAPHWTVVHPAYEDLITECTTLLGDETPGQIFPLLRSELAAVDSTPLPELRGLSGLAYIIFTSGSTGSPKGVQITHSGAVHYIQWLVDHFRIGPDERLSGHPPFHFDLSVLDIFGTLAAGAQLHLVPDEANVLPHRTANFIREHRITQWTSVPSVLTGMERRKVVHPGDFPELRRIICSGDVLPTSVVAYWLQRAPHITIVNTWGATETSVASSFHELREAPSDLQDPIPIGKAVPGEELAVLHADGSRAAVREPGNLCIAGPGLSPGYWADPEKTAQAFKHFPSPDGQKRWYVTGDRGYVDESGTFHFQGRTDRQVKSRGYRIELDEVAVAVNALPEVAEAAVISLPVAGMEGSRLYAACAVRPGVKEDPTALRAALLKRLPEYMVPTGWYFLDDIPKSANGKTDNQAVEKVIKSLSGVTTRRFHDK